MSQPPTPRYTFWITDVNDNEILWEGLSKSQALAMYRNTEKHADFDAVMRYGWKEEK